MLEIDKSQLKDVPVVVNVSDDANALSVTSVTPIEPKADKLDPELDDKNVGELKVEEVTEPATEEKAKEVIDEVIEDEPPKEEIKEPPKKEEPQKAKDAVQKRIDEITKKYRVTERERDAERKLREELEAKVAELESKIPATDKPKAEDFETEAEFLEALTDWKVELKIKQLSGQGESVLKNQEMEKAIEKAEEPYQELDKYIALGRKEYEDFDEAVLTDQTLPLTDTMVDAALNLETPHKVLYYLAQHKDESLEISKMSVPKMAIALSKIDAKLNAPAPKVIVKHVSKAAEPITPVDSSGAVEVPLGELSFKDYVKKRQAGKT